MHMHSDRTQKKTVINKQAMHETGGASNFVFLTASKIVLEK
jgi:hypothetical protein